MFLFGILASIIRTFVKWTLFLLFASVFLLFAAAYLLDWDTLLRERVANVGRDTGLQVAIGGKPRVVAAFPPRIVVPDVTVRTPGRPASGQRRAVAPVEVMKAPRAELSIDIDALMTRGRTGLSVRVFDPLISLGADIDVASIA